MLLASTSKSHVNDVNKLVKVGDHIPHSQQSQNTEISTIVLSKAKHRDFLKEFASGTIKL